MLVHPGKYAEILIASDATVTGVDISPRMIELAKERNRQAGNFFVHNPSHPLPMLENTTFDIVISALAMHYIEDWTTTIREFYRVLKPKGLLAISIEHPFFEFNYFLSKQYFKVEPGKCYWNNFGKRIEMNSYRRHAGKCNPHNCQWFLYRPVN